MILNYIIIEKYQGLESRKELYFYRVIGMGMSGGIFSLDDSGIY
jgi:hypothetical protein